MINIIIIITTITTSTITLLFERFYNIETSCILREGRICVFK